MTSSALSHVHLVSCIGVDTELAHLAHFIDHYRALGVSPSRCHLVLNTDDVASPNIEAARAVLAARGIEAAEIWIAPYTSAAMWAKRREIQAACVPESAWVVSADVDELHEYPVSLTELTAYCERHDFDCVQGVMIDRLAGDGRLRSVSPDTSLSDTFPLEVDIQCSIGRSGVDYNVYGTVKAMLFRAYLMPDQGGHDVLESKPGARYLFGQSLAKFDGVDQAGFRFAFPMCVHHYKWTASMPTALRRRLATPGVSPAGAEYGQRLLDYIGDDERIDPGLVPVRDATTVRASGWKRRAAILRRRARLARFKKKFGRKTGKFMRRLTK